MRAMSEKIYLSRFRTAAARHRTPQGESLERLAAAHARARRENLADYRALFQRYGCRPEVVSARGHEVEDLGEVAEAGFARRAELFAGGAERMLEEVLPREEEAPDHLIHVTCTGYVAPSAAQRLAASRAWPTLVTHAYHMGCAGAFPALRMAAAFALRGGRVEVAHTELCSLHLDASDHEIDQLVGQGLFADGGAAYSVGLARPSGPALALVAARERLLPGTEDAMTWRPGRAAMRMTLSKRLPALVRENLKPFVDDLLAEAGLVPEASRRCAFALHPGGPRIVDAAVEALGLDESQVVWSRRVLREHGNMSSATIPHVWKAIVDDPSVSPGTLVPSVAFGPGLTVTGALFRKV